MKRLWLIFGCVALLAGCATSPSTPVEPAVQSDPARFVVVTLRNDTAPSMPRAGSTVRGYEPPPSYSLAPATRASAQAVAVSDYDGATRIAFALASEVDDSGAFQQRNGVVGRGICVNQERASHWVHRTDLHRLRSK